MAFPRSTAVGPSRPRLLAELLTLLALVALTVSAGACSKNKPGGTVSPAGDGVQSDRRAVREQAPAPATRQACDTCEGRWGRHGIADVESCICKTRDGGKECRDGSECSGQCLASDEGGFEVQEAGPPAKGYWRGTCSEYESTFGCNRIIPTGAKQRPARVAEEAADNICID